MKRTLLLLSSWLMASLAFGQAGNYFAGTTAGAANTIGSYNAFVGYAAGKNNTTGNSNSFVGNFAGYSNTTGSGNTFVGSGAGVTSETGQDNSFFGFAAGNRTTGSFNSFYGTWSGYQNTTGNYNAFFGADAGRINTTGYQNNFFGYRSGYNNLGGYGNAFFGHQSGNKNTTGNLNTFIGYEAGYNNTTGGANTSLGNRAGRFLTTGSRNTLLASQAGENTTGSDNTFIGHKAGVTNTVGNNNTALGNYAGPGLTNLTNATAIGFRAHVTGSNSLVLGSINGKNGATVDTKVGIGLTNPSYRFQLGVNSAAKPGTSTWTVASDERLKQDVAEFKDGLLVLEKIKPVWFRYNGKAGMPTDQRYVGVIAQQMQQIAPYTVGEFIYQDSTGQQSTYLDYDANALTYVLVNSVKELKQENERKEAKIVALEARLALLEQLVFKQNPIPTLTDEVARLFQNEPNPTDGSTLIRFQIPTLAANAQLKVFSSTGQELHAFELTQRGQGQLTLPANLLPSGTYVYQLIVDHQSIDTKKLLIVR